ncbi:TetR/AcrR family transcriptional regulator [Nocardia neocaledoniensis]|uniref:TetR/AcrR family transcriptional regulator n=1 Tax=Nocardia neocaledoniensis TaxID=236511 RepID=UPI0024580B81|nr:TetR/AcrR family transcriptional regulator [Nocardia neocaledoniensis]
MSDRPRKAPRQRRSRETVEVLLEAAAQVFAREGAAATTNRIAERAGVSIGTLYQYFPNKQAMLRMLGERHVAEAGARLDEVCARLRRDQPAFDDTLRAILETVVDLHRERPALHALLHRVGTSLPGEIAAMRAFEDHLVAEIEFHLRRCDRGGPDPLLTARTLVQVVDAQVHRVLTRHAVRTDALMALCLRLIDG